MKKLLLISNSTLHGGGYLDHCADEIKNFLGNIRSILFVPYARPGGISHEEYTKKAAERYMKMGISLSGIHEQSLPIDAVRDAEAMFIGGGNTFVLLDGLKKNGILPVIRERIESGMPYIGTSAGSNVACPTIMTTNDMPVREVDDFQAISAVDFQINAHYIEPAPDSKHMGETRATRIKEYLTYNNRTVVGLREGAMLEVLDSEVTLKGTTGAKIFPKNEQPYDISPINTLEI